MQYSLLSVSLLLSLAAAAATTSESSLTTSAATGASTTFSVAAGEASACGAQPVLDACIASTQAIASACSAADYGCLCSKWTDVLTCFNVCPNDSRQGGALSSKLAYCANAVQYPSSTPSAISRPVSSTGSAATATGTGSGSGSSGSQTSGSDGAVRVASSTGGSASKTSSGSSSSSTEKANAGSKGLAVGAGGVLMGLAGVVGAFL